MKIERVRPAILQVTLSAYELSALIAAARWVAEGAEGELAPEAMEQLQQVLASYEAAANGQGPSRERGA
jgi:hypothetical protein